MIVYICNMNKSSYKTLMQNYSAIKVSGFNDRYLGYEQLKDYLDNNVFPFYSHRVIGQSELKRSIYEVNIGKGANKILIWSQMHGNETTTTKALLDFLNYIHLNKNTSFVKALIAKCTIKIIPMLNPDGATVYNRLNAHNKDLNRDAIKQSQSETKAFFKVLNDFEPDYCFNMHGQRTLFSAGKADYPATLSFLSPSINDDRSVTPTRKVGMQLISAAYEMLQDFIPNQIGRYDDAYNPNCFGDYIQSKDVPTVLFEAGHYQNDYCRNKTRQFVFLSLLKMLDVISGGEFSKYNYKTYFDIPMNQKLYYDCIISGAENLYPNDVGIVYKEQLAEESVQFKPVIEALKPLNHFYSHRSIEAKQNKLTINSQSDIKIGDTIEQLRIADQEFDLNV